MVHTLNNDAKLYPFERGTATIFNPFAAKIKHGVSRLSRKEMKGIAAILKKIIYKKFAILSLVCKFVC